MSNYTRNRVAGGTYFFTVNLANRRTTLLVDHIVLLRRVVARARTLLPFHIDAWVVLPDHLHCVWTLPEDDADYPRRWRAIKMSFSRSMEPGEAVSRSRGERGERGIWQRRYWEHTIRDDADYAAHVDYTHFNPVKHGLVEDASHWPHSTFHRCAARGLYPPGWSGKDDPTRQWGEP